MKRAYFDCPITELQRHGDDEILGALAGAHAHSLELTQRDAWIEQISSLRDALKSLKEGHLYLEFAIPRMGKRADAVVLVGRNIVVLEYKVGAKTYDAEAMRQVVDYALDLKNFHETSHSRRIVPILVATDAPTVAAESSWYGDDVAAPIRANLSTLPFLLEDLATDSLNVEPREWEAGRYKPTPTIVEAATALYRGHSVADISRSDAGAINLTRTRDALTMAIERAEAASRKTICFVTGVPGSGKTLAGLNFVTRQMSAEADEHAVFLSGNGPLVLVLREALTKDDVKRAKEQNTRLTKESARQKARTFIQNIHHFRDEALQSHEPPIERVVVFDEAQRAWDREQTASFMRQKRGLHSFDMSEPEFLLSVMDRHRDWCVVVCLVGTGQEIHTGEAGIGEWFDALSRRFPHWAVYVSPQLSSDEADASLGRLERVLEEPALHLGVSMRSFRAERLSEFVASVIAGDSAEASHIKQDLEKYPLAVTRDLRSAQEWLRRRARGGERYGLVASSNALRLKPEGLHVKAGISTVNWFLDGPEDVRSSFALEDAASEFEVQGLELDWVGLCWDANLRFRNGWESFRFSGSRWQKIQGERRAFLLNAYRVLLTRARQGLIVFVPRGDSRDSTRPPSFYDGTFDFLIRCGFEQASESADRAV